MFTYFACNCVHAHLRKKVGTVYYNKSLPFYSLDKKKDKGICITVKKSISYLINY